MIVVATEGGGIRAAYWTATVLSELHDRVPGFAEHCFAIGWVLSDEAMDAINQGINCEAGNRSAVAILAKELQTQAPTLQCDGKSFPPPNPPPPVDCNGHGCVAGDVKGQIE